MKRWSGSTQTLLPPEAFNLGDFLLQDCLRVEFKRMPPALNTGIRMGPNAFAAIVFIAIICLTRAVPSSAAQHSTRILKSSSLRHHHVNGIAPPSPSRSPSSKGRRHVRSLSGTSATRAGTRHGRARTLPPQETGRTKSRHGSATRLRNKGEARERSERRGHRHNRSQARAIPVEHQKASRQHVEKMKKPRSRLP